MLADSCPECGVPLMRSPDGSQLLCTNCGRDTTAAEPATAPGAAAEEPAGAQQPQPPLANGTGGPASSSDDEESLLQPPPPLRTRLRATVGLLAATSADQHAPSAASALQQLPVPAPTPPARQAASARRSGSSEGREEASKAIAEMMLEGWAMLQDHCPRCLNPLLRSRDRSRIYCAGCRLDAVREGEQQATAAAPAEAGAASLPASAGAGSIRAAALPAAAAPGGAAGRSVAPVQQQLDAVDAAGAAVAARLSAATAALPAAGEAQAAQLLDEVRRCAAALQALAEARAAMPSTPAAR